MRLQAPDPAISAVSVGHATFAVNGGAVDVPDAPTLGDDATEDEQREAFAARTVIAELLTLGFTAASAPAPAAPASPSRPAPVTTPPPAMAPSAPPASTAPTEGS